MDDVRREIWEKEENLTEAVRRYLELRPGFFQVDVRTGDGRLIEGKKSM